MEANFDLAIQTRLIRNGDRVCQALPATIKNFRRWMVIYKYREGADYLPEERLINWEYSVFDFEVNEAYFKLDFSDEQMLNQKRYYVKDLDELKALLKSLEIDITKFTYPWRAECPR